MTYSADADGQVTPTFEQVRKIIRENMGLDEEEITPTTHLVDDLGADSLDEIELVMEFEDAYEIEIDETSEEVYRIRTVQDIVDFLKQTVAAKGSKR